MLKLWQSEKYVSGGKSETTEISNDHDRRVTNSVLSHLHCFSSYPTVFNAPCSIIIMEICMELRARKRNNDDGFGTVL